jgi:hypothetical protein
MNNWHMCISNALESSCVSSAPVARPVVGDWWVVELAPVGAFEVVVMVAASVLDGCLILSVSVACVTHASLTRAVMCGDQTFVGTGDAL